MPCYEPRVRGRLRDALAVFMGRAVAIQWPHHRPGHLPALSVGLPASGAVSGVDAGRAGFGGINASTVKQRVEIENDLLTSDAVPTSSEGGYAMCQSCSTATWCAKAKACLAETSPDNNPEVARALAAVSEDSGPPQERHK